MSSERLRILASPEQRRRLENEARAAHTSVARLIRDAIDARYTASDRDSRLRALEAIRGMSATFVPAAELDGLAESERDHDEDVMLS